MNNPTVANYFELDNLGIKKVIRLGKNEFGFNEKIIELNDGTQYDFIPEDNLYEKRSSKYQVEIN